MKKIYTANNPAEAYLVKGMVESHKIKCEVRGEQLFGARGELPVTPDTLPSVWIFDDNEYHNARTLIAEYDDRNKEDIKDTTVWTCSNCEEESESQFTQCWNCGSGRPDTT